jgi:hypothetical protein
VVDGWVIGSGDFGVRWWKLINSYLVLVNWRSNTLAARASRRRRRHWIEL